MTNNRWCIYLPRHHCDDAQSAVMLDTDDCILHDIISSAVASEQDDEVHGAVLTFVLRISQEQTWLSRTKAMPLSVDTSPFSLITLNSRIWKHGWQNLLNKQSLCHINMRDVPSFTCLSCRCLLAQAGAAQTEQQYDNVSKVRVSLT